jgi:putative ABC transport system substrate-binding protein
MAINIARRKFLVALGGTAFAWPLVATCPLAVHAQTASTVRRIGFMLPGLARADSSRLVLNAFHQGLQEHGWIEGQNLSVEYRFAEGDQKQLPEIAMELVRLGLEVIVAESSPAIQAAKNATQSIPIVMATSIDPVQSGFVESLSRPAGNVTGMSLLTAELSGKRLQLLTEIVPGLSRVVALLNSANPAATLSLRQTQAAAQSLGIELHPVEVRTPDEFESAFAAITALRARAIIILPDGLLYNQHARIVAFAATSRLPALYPEKEVVQDGGLIAYGPSIPASFRRAAAFVDKILRGAKPADLPVEQPTKFDLVINLKTAKALGLTIPHNLLVLADEVIE